VRKNITKETESRECGIFNILLQGNETVNACPISQQVANIPYYETNQGVGSLFALRISGSDPHDATQSLPFWILSVDRAESTPWTDAEKKLLHLTAKKLHKELTIGDQLIKTARHSAIVSKLYEGLQGLNSVLELEETFNIAVKYVKELLAADLVAISLANDHEHTIARADGYQAGGLEGCKFKISDGLVGKAIQCNHWMPPTASYPDPAPIFTKESPLKGFKSLLIVPLCQSGQAAMGALTIASRKPGMFGQEQRNIMELIGGQIATKIELAQAHEKIYQMALTDGLTGLNNHRTFQLGLDNMLTRARRQGSSLCLILCDIDHFKKINDTHGHPFGDQVLKKVAATLKQSIRQVDLTARYGGEEFALILEASDEEGGLIQAERVRQSIEDLVFNSKGEKITITMSFGLASHPMAGESKADLIDKADQALYAAKEAGRNRTMAWSDLQ
jgi:diguanylate cyclase (GGDEF)-like protein